MDNTSVRHICDLWFEAHEDVRAYVKTGRIELDLRGLHGINKPIRLGQADAEDLARIILAALADKES